MTRQMSVGMMKGRRGPKLNADGKPRLGTKLREAYDALRRGEIVRAQDFGMGVAHQLRDYYGMVLESRRGPLGYTRLLGEWIGDIYVLAEDIYVEPDESSVEPVHDEPRNTGSLLDALREALDAK